LASYYDRQFTWLDMFTLFFPGIMASLLPLGYGLFLVEKNYSRFGPAAIIPSSYVWFLVSFIAFLIFGGLFIYRLLLSYSYLALYEGGIIYAHYKKQTLVWNQVSAIQTKIIARSILTKLIKSRYHCTIVTRSNHALHISPSLQSIEEIVIRIKAKAYPQLLSEFRNNFTKGESLKFGKITSLIDGLKIKNQMYLWQDIRRITVQAGRLIIELWKSKTIQIPTGDIPNIELLLELIPSINLAN
jgi:hypothetical protein